MGRIEKEKILHLSDDLIKDSMIKMRQIIDIRKEHEVFISYHIGMIMGRIQEKYRYMVETYRDILDKWNDRSDLQPPGWINKRPFHYIIALEMMHYLSVEIDKLLDVLEETATEDMKSPHFLIGRPIPMVRTGPERSEINEYVKQETEKSLLRQRYLMKKIGQPVNLTTSKKRFFRQWPVEDTWALEKYDYQ